MVIREPNGLTFLNYLRTICDSVLQISANNVIFILKTYFVGHDENGGVTYLDIIPALPLTLTDMNADIDSSGSTYTLAMKPLQGSLQNIPQIHKIQKNNSYSTDGLLIDLIKDFEKKLNQDLAKQYNAVKGGKKTRYAFTIPTAWKSYRIETTNSDNQVEDPKSQKSVGKLHVSVPPNSTVDEILQIFIDKCPEAINSFAVKDGKYTRFWRLESTKTSDDNEDVFRYDVREVFSYDTPYEAELEKKQDASQFALDNSYGLIFDYYYSGKNTDILKLDLKFPQAHVFLLADQYSTATALGTSGERDKSKTPDATNRSAKDTKADVKIESVGSQLKPNDPVYQATRPAHTTYDLDATQLMINNRQKYLANLMNFSVSGTGLNAEIEIRGNPIFLSQIVSGIPPTKDSEYESEVQKQAKQAQDAADGKIVKPTANKVTNADLFGRVPVFVKLNIYTPATNSVGPHASYINSQGNTVEGYQKFWYDGWYRIFQIDNYFENGDFKQKLYLKAQSRDTKK